MINVGRPPSSGSANGGLNCWMWPADVPDVKAALAAPGMPAILWSSSCRFRTPATHGN
jgi:hypothetical protein